MFNRRTLATITAVAALSGGAAGGVTSSFTAPEGATAAEPPRININPGTPPDNKLGTPTARKTITDSMKISWIWAEVHKPSQAQVRTDARMAALDAKVDGVNGRTVETKETLDSLVGMTARSASGRSLINLVEDTLHKTRLICAETVPDEYLGIGIGDHESGCD